LNEPTEKTRFQVYLWPQRVLVLAPAFATATHRHHAAQIALGLDGPVVFESPKTGLLRADIVLVSPDSPHAHPAFGPWAGLFLDPESADWKQFARRKEGPLASLPFDQRLRSVARRAAGGDAVAARSLVDGLIGERAAEAVHDDALVSRARALIRQHLDRKVRLADLAGSLHCSPSRLAHRFKDAIGVPLRRYVLWCRLRAAGEAALRGSSLTEAAQVAGFADSAHLSRTFRGMFGVVPSFIFKGGSVDVTFCDGVAST
jgi:AraC family transcriptional regulator